MLHSVHSVCVWWVKQKHYYAADVMTAWNTPKTLWHSEWNNYHNPRNYQCYLLCLLCMAHPSTSGYDTPFVINQITSSCRRYDCMPTRPQRFVDCFVIQDGTFTTKRNRTLPQYVYCVLSSSVAYNHIWVSNLSSRVKQNSIFQPTLWLDANTPTTVCGPLWHSGLSSLSMRIVVANISGLAIGMIFCSQIKCVLTWGKEAIKELFPERSFFFEYLWFIFWKTSFAYSTQELFCLVVLI